MFDNSGSNDDQKKEIESVNENWVKLYLLTNICSTRHS